MIEQTVATPPYVPTTSRPLTSERTPLGHISRAETRKSASCARRKFKVNISNPNPNYVEKNPSRKHASTVDNYTMIRENETSK